MNKNDFASLSVDDLWRLYEDVREVLSGKINAERKELEAKLARLQQTLPQRVEPSTNVRRKYPRVPQKYQNPQDPGQTWSGRGKQPVWILELLNAGVRLDDLIKPEYRTRRR